ncbi:hypothetical protein KJ765_00810 [Candidatus Micrarchaeota archaeon]|nr:hypothetical protein [Candidatus Micrarchaeota archaeon]
MKTSHTKTEKQIHLVTKEKLWWEVTSAIFSMDRGIFAIILGVVSFFIIGGDLLTKISFFVGSYLFIAFLLFIRTLFVQTYENFETIEKYLNEKK